MKKLFALVALAAAMVFGACTNKIEEGLDFSKASADEVVSALAEKLQTGDATVISKALETVQTQLSKLLKGTDVAKVTEYATKIKAFVEENAEALKSFNIDVAPLTKVFDEVAALPVDAAAAAEDAAEDAVEGAVDAAEDAVEGAVDAVEGAVNDAVDAAKGAVDDAVDAGKAAVEEGKAKTNEAIQNAADKIKL
ncbi:MAG: hypothetical protein IKU02_05735 [Bacteroidaceae bacterium]|nr:hypothetical protein [Bacteroidaceae bacterium]